MRSTPIQDITPFQNRTTDVLLNYADVINYERNSQRGLHHCVMCGRIKGNGCEIPNQNKDVCKSCDSIYWKVITLNAIVKFCKGCKNFCTISLFGEKPIASKCSKCRQRGRVNYHAKKESGGNGERSQDLIVPHLDDRPSAESITTKATTGQENAGHQRIPPYSRPPRPLQAHTPSHLHVNHVDARDEPTPSSSPFLFSPAPSRLSYGGHPFSVISHPHSNTIPTSHSSSTLPSSQCLSPVTFSINPPHAPPTASSAINQSDCDMLLCTPSLALYLSTPVPLLDGEGRKMSPSLAIGPMNMPGTQSPFSQAPLPSPSPGQWAELSFSSVTYDPDQYAQIPDYNNPHILPDPQRVLGDDASAWDPAVDLLLNLATVATHVPSSSTYPSTHHGITSNSSRNSNQNYRLSNNPPLGTMSIPLSMSSPVTGRLSATSSNMSNSTSHDTDTSNSSGRSSIAAANAGVVCREEVHSVERKSESPSQVKHQQHNNNTTTTTSPIKPLSDAGHCELISSPTPSQGSTISPPPRMKCTDILIDNSSLVGKRLRTNFIASSSTILPDEDQCSSYIHSLASPSYIPIGSPQNEQLSGPTEIANHDGRWEEEERSTAKRIKLSEE